MVFSVASFSLQPLLDMSAAMEKALAREDSWGLGDAVNSMAPSARSWPGTGLAAQPSSFDGNTVQSFRVSPLQSRGLQMSQSQPPKGSTLASPILSRKALEPQRLGSSRQRREKTSRRLTRERKPRGTPQDHRLRRRKLETSMS